MNTAARRHHNVAHRVILSAAMLVVTVAAAGCEDAARSLFDELARRDCRTDAPIRVSDDRVAYLFAHNHVYRPQGQNEDWANELVNTRIPSGYEEMNPVLTASWRAKMVAASAVAAIV
jgi:hypothetical protein